MKISTSFKHLFGAASGWLVSLIGRTDLRCNSDQHNVLAEKYEHKLHSNK